MNQIQAQFKRKLTGFSVLLVFMIFAVCCVGVFKAVAQTEDTETVSKTTHPEEQKSAPYANPDVIKYAFLAAAIAVGVGSLGAGAAVGYVGASAMGAIGEKPELAGRALIFVGLAEGIAIYGLIIAIMILGKI